MFFQSRYGSLTHRTVVTDFTHSYILIMVLLPSGISGMLVELLTE